MEIGNDVWFVGHCIVSPIKAEDKSMAMVGSVITKDMSYNEIYAGSPAVSISNKIGNQFNFISNEIKLEIMNQYLIDFDINCDNIIIVNNDNDINLKDNITYFNVSNRKYTKKQTENEIAFMKFLLPEKAKFTPL
jgi:hypothetical protein